MKISIFSALIALVVCNTAIAEQPEVTANFLQSIPTGHAVLNMAPIYISSPSKSYCAFVEQNGLLSVYPGPDPSHVTGPKLYSWGSAQAVVAGGYALAMQNDGNLVLYRNPITAANAYKQSDTALRASHYFLSLEDNGDLLVYEGLYPTKGCKVFDVKNEARGVDYQCTCYTTVSVSGSGVKIGQWTKSDYTRARCDADCPSGPLSSGGHFHPECK